MFPTLEGTGARLAVLMTVIALSSCDGRGPAGPEGADGGADVEIGEVDQGLQQGLTFRVYVPDATALGGWGVRVVSPFSPAPGQTANDVYNALSGSCPTAAEMLPSLPSGFACTATVGLLYRYECLGRGYLDLAESTGAIDVYDVGGGRRKFVPRAQLAASGVDVATASKLMWFPVPSTADRAALTSLALSTMGSMFNDFHQLERCAKDYANAPNVLGSRPDDGGAPQPLFVSIAAKIAEFVRTDIEATDALQAAIIAAAQKGRADQAGPEAITREWLTPPTSRLGAVARLFDIPQQLMTTEPFDTRAGASVFQAAGGAQYPIAGLPAATPLERLAEKLIRQAAVYPSPAAGASARWLDAIRYALVERDPRTWREVHARAGTTAAFFAALKLDEATLVRAGARILKDVEARGRQVLTLDESNTLLPSAVSPIVDTAGTILAYHVTGLSPDAAPTHPIYYLLRTSGAAMSLPDGASILSPAGALGDSSHMGRIHRSLSALKYLRAMTETNTAFPIDQRRQIAAMLDGTSLMVRDRFPSDLAIFSNLLTTEAGSTTGAQVSENPPFANTTLYILGPAVDAARYEFWIGEAALECGLTGKIEGRACVEAAARRMPDVVQSGCLPPDYPAFDGNGDYGLHAFSKRSGPYLVADCHAWKLDGLPRYAHVYVTKKDDNDAREPIYGFIADGRPDSGSYVERWAPQYSSPVILSKLQAILEPASEDASRPYLTCAGLPREMRLPLEDGLSNPNRDDSGEESSYSHYLTLARTAADEADLLGEELFRQGLDMDIRAETARDNLEELCGGVVNVQSLSPTACTTDCGCCPDSCVAGSCGAAGAHCDAGYCMGGSLTSRLAGQNSTAQDLSSISRCLSREQNELVSEGLGDRLLCAFKIDNFPPCAGCVGNDCPMKSCPVVAALGTTRDEECRKAFIRPAVASGGHGAPVPVLLDRPVGLYVSNFNAPEPSDCRALAALRGSHTDFGAALTHAWVNSPEVPNFETHAALQNYLDTKIDTSKSDWKKIVRKAGIDDFLKDTPWFYQDAIHAIAESVDYSLDQFGFVSVTKNGKPWLWTGSVQAGPNRTRYPSVPLLEATDPYHKGLGCDQANVYGVWGKSILCGLDVNRLQRAVEVLHVIGNRSVVRRQRSYVLSAVSGSSTGLVYQTRRPTWFPPASFVDSAFMTNNSKVTLEFLASDQTARTYLPGWTVPFLTTSSEEGKQLNTKKLSPVYSTFGDRLCVSDPINIASPSFPVGGSCDYAPVLMDASYNSPKDRSKVESYWDNPTVIRCRTDFDRKYDRCNDDPRSHMYSIDAGLWVTFHQQKNPLGFGGRPYTSGGAIDSPLGDIQPGFETNIRASPDVLDALELACLANIDGGAGGCSYDVDLAVDARNLTDFGVLADNLACAADRIEANLERMALINAPKAVVDALREGVVTNVFPQYRGSYGQEVAQLQSYLQSAVDATRTVISNVRNFSNDVRLTENAIEQLDNDYAVLSNNVAVLQVNADLAKQTTALNQAIIENQKEIAATQGQIEGTNAEQIAVLQGNVAASQQQVVETRKSILNSSNTIREQQEIMEDIRGGAQCAAAVAGTIDAAVSKSPVGLIGGGAVPMPWAQIAECAAFAGSAYSRKQVRDAEEDIAENEATILDEEQKQSMAQAGIASIGELNARLRLKMSQKEIDNLDLQEKIALVQLDATLQSNNLEQQSVALQQSNVDLQRDASMLELGNRFMERMDALGGATRQLFQAYSDIHRSMTRLEQIRSEAEVAAAKVLLLDSDTMGREYSVNRVMRKRMNTLRVRYEAARENAVRMAWIARRAVEQRFAVNLSEMVTPLNLVEAPSTWADDVCVLSGIDYERIRDKTSTPVQDPLQDNFSDGYIGDYVTKLENFVESYRFDFPFTDGSDIAVVSLRDDLLGVKATCDGEAINLLHHTSDLKSTPSGTDAEGALGEPLWQTTCGANERCLRTDRGVIGPAGGNLGAGAPVALRQIVPQDPAVLNSATSLPVSQGLKRWLRADQCIATVRTSDGARSVQCSNGADGTANTFTAPYSQEWSPGLSMFAANERPALEFDNNDYLFSPEVAGSTYGDFTVVTAVRMNAAIAWYASGSTPTTSTVYILRTQTDGSVLVTTLTRPAGSTAPYTSRLLSSPAGLVPSGVWKSVALVVQGTTRTLFVDGVAVASDGNGAPFGTNWVAYYGSGGSSPGGLAEALLYDRALSHSEVSSVWGYLAGRYDLAGSPSAPAAMASRPRLSQRVQLQRGEYRLSWYEPVGNTSSLLTGLTPIDSPATAISSGGTLAMASGPTWVRRAKDFTVLQDTEAVVEFGLPLGVATTWLAQPQLELAGMRWSGTPASYVATGESRLVHNVPCEDRDGSVFRKTAWRYACEYICPGGEGACDGLRNVNTLPTQCFWETSFDISADAIDRGELLPTAGFAKGNFNYRIGSLALNVVGTGVRDCTSVSNASACYASQYLQYELKHDGPFTVRSYDGSDYEAPLFNGTIKSAKALMAERYLTNPVSSADRGLLSDYWRSEFSGRPLNGHYVLRIYDNEGLMFTAIEDVQILLRYRYWTRFN